MHKLKASLSISKGRRFQAYLI